jgi:hypothetical protein
MATCINGTEERACATGANYYLQCETGGKCAALGFDFATNRSGAVRKDETYASDFRTCAHFDSVALFYSLYLGAHKR